MADNYNLENLNYKDRIKRLERMLNPDEQLKQKQTIQALREEVASLREQVEQQAHLVQNMKQRQRNLYLDIDRRISRVEAGGRANKTTLNGLGDPSPSSNTAAEHHLENSAGLATNVPTLPASGLPVPTLPVGAASTVVKQNTATQAQLNSSAESDGQAQYNQAFNLLKEGQYEQSITAFTNFKANFPNSQYVDNAQYWLGEAHYVLRQYDKSLALFSALIKNYPNSQKIAGARLKIGYIYYELKSWSAARETLQQLAKYFPGTSSAKKAQDRLARMKREGH